MLSDARTLWQSASSAIASFNENISTALDNLDKDASEEDKLAMEQIQKDLHEYKKLLDDAQMQHFELSKQSRMLLAEKDAELSYWKQLAQKEGHSVGDGEQTSLQVVKLQAEKAAIEESLKEVQEQLRSSLREKNDYDMLLKNYNSLSNRFETVKADLTSLKSDGDAKDKQKSDTIENLVQEYSTLAAEAELMQTQANKRSAELKKENEVLVTKIQALEHSISELADRTVARSEVTSQASVSTPSTPGISCYLR